MRAHTKKLIIVFVLGLCFYSYRAFHLSDYLRLDTLKAEHAVLTTYYHAHPVEMLVGYFLIYLLLTTVSIPASAMLSLAGGSIFGLKLGIPLAAFASNLGATGAMIISRWLFQDPIRRRFPQAMDKISRGMAKEGAFYLFTIRLIPIFPAFIVNLAMGITMLSPFVFFLVSLVGTLPITMAYVNAGTQLSRISSMRDVLTPRLVLSFVVIGFLPLVSKWLLVFYRRKRNTNLV